MLKGRFRTIIERLRTPGEWCSKEWGRENLISISLIMWGFNGLWSKIIY
jgi:hypothetical protein